MGPNLPDKPLSLPSAFSRTEGKDKNRNVCPVGAVSKTITENSIDLTCLPLAPFLPAQADSLHDLRETHCLVHTRNGKGKILHHPAHTPTLVRYH